MNPGELLKGPRRTDGVWMGGRVTVELLLNKRAVLTSCLGNGTQGVVYERRVSVTVFVEGYSYSSFSWCGFTQLPFCFVS